MIDYNVIPKSWKPLKLGEVCIVRNGYAFKSVDFKNNGVLLFRQTNLDGENVKLKNAVYLPEEYLEKYKEYKILKGDVLVGMSGSIGKMCVYNLEKPALQNQRTGLLRFTDLVEKKYIRYYFEVLEQVFIKKSKGVAVLNISAKDIQESEFHLPSIPEQQAIVDKIEELLSELENGKQQLLIAQQQLKVYRQSLLKWLYDKSIGSIPIKLIDVCDFITKGTTPSKDKLFSTKGDVPFLKVYNLTFNGTLDFSKDPTFVDNETHNVFLKRSIVFPDDVLMNIVGPPLGKVSIVPATYPEWNINQAMVRFRCKEKLFNKYLLYFLLCENTIRTYSRKAKATAGQFNLTLEICRDIKIPLPSLKEQKLIVDELESKLTVCDKIEETISQSLQQSETLRQSILKKAFEGKLI
jgi:type I restriction enzyme S subunit